MKDISLATSVVEDDILSLSENTINTLKNISGSQIVVTGASGFLASSLVLYIAYISKIYNLDINVRALARNRNRFISRLDQRFSGLLKKEIDVEIYEASSCLTTKQGCDYFVHAASNANPMSFANDPYGTALANTMGTVNAIKYAEANSTKGFLLFSTSGVYGHQEQDKYPLTEDDYGYLDPTKPENIYLISKKASECILSTSKNKSGISYNIIRPSINYGPGMSLDDERSFPYFLKSGLSKERIKLNSNGSSLRNYLYTRDFIDAIIPLIVTPYNEAFNVASSRDTSIKELASLIHTQSKMNEDVIINNENTTIQRVEFKRTTTSQYKLTEKTGWEEKTSLNDGLAKTLAHYRELGY